MSEFKVSHTEEELSEDKTFFSLQLCKIRYDSFLSTSWNGKKCQ